MGAWWDWPADFPEAPEQVPAWRDWPADPPEAAEAKGAEPSWLAAAWSALPKRERRILARRAASETLDAIGQDEGVSRERVRQVQRTAEKALLGAAGRFAPDLPDPVMRSPTDGTIEALLAHLPDDTPPEARISALRALGNAHPGPWTGALGGRGNRAEEELRARVQEVAKLAPLLSADMESALSEVGLRASGPVLALLESATMRLARHHLGWVRSGRITRDLVYLWLLQEGAARTVAEIASVAGASEHAVRESMRRDRDFAQVRPEGTWALTDWRLAGTTNQYRNAEEVVIEVLRDRGPLGVSELRAETRRRYPVTDWRITQCLSSAMIGRLPDGRYDLAERGAAPVEDTEPRRPASIESHGAVIGVRLTVDHDVLRGSGLAVNRWLTWKLGLRIAPSIRVFEMAGAGAPVTIKRGTSTSSQISSLRLAVQALDLAEGCRIVRLLRTDDNTAQVLHVCPTGRCPVL